MSEAENAAALPAGRKGDWFGCFVKVLIALPVLVILAGIVAGVWLWRVKAGYQQELAAEIQRIREAGEPLDGSELNAWYRVPKGQQDLTPHYLEMFGLLQDKTDAQTSGIEGLDATGIPYFDTEIEAIPLPGEPWEGIERSEAFLAHYAEPLQRLLALNQTTGAARFPIDARDGLGMNLDHLQSLRTLMRLCCLRAQVLCHRQDYPGATDSLIAGLRVAEAIKNEPVLVSQLVRIAAHRSVADAICCMLTDSEFPAAEIARLQAELEAINRDSAAHVAVLGERTMLYQIALGTLSDIESDLPQSLGATDRPLLELRPGDCAFMLRFASDAVDASKQPYPEAWRAQSAVSQKMNQQINGEKAMLPWNRNILSALLLPAYDVAFRALADAAARHRCLVVLLAAERYRREEGIYPSELNSLIPRFIEQLPLDVYTGQPLLFARDGARFTVYSVGEDLQDDGGDTKWNPGGFEADMGHAVPPHRMEDAATSP